jgi:4,5-DOPA dioxygenase extradiol
MAAMTPAPAHAFDSFLVDAVPRSRAQRVWTPEDGALPSIYLGHGAPPLLDDARWMDQLFTWSQDLPKPRAVLIVSAHWEHAPISITSTDAAPRLVYDFGGFEQRFYEMTYPTPEASELGREVAALLPDTEDLHEHRSRGLDHGAWVPLKVMYPLADVPVLQLSLPTHDPERLIALGRRLAPLREQGVLVIGSGFLTHGLPFLTPEIFLGAAPPPGWSVDFDAWAADALARGDVDELAAFRDRAPGMPYAHPTVEHFTPLFVTLGAGAGPAPSGTARPDVDRPVDTVIDGFAFGLAKRSFQLT